MNLSVSNIISISVQPSLAGLQPLNPSQIALFTSETPTDGFEDGYKIFVEPGSVAECFGSSNIVTRMANSIFSQRPNILLPGGYLVVVLLDDEGGGETFPEAVLRAQSEVSFFGVLVDEILNDSDSMDLAEAVQPLNKMLGLVARDSSVLTATTGTFDKVRLAGYDKTRCLYYGADNDEDALVMGAAYFGRGLSTVFSGNRTTGTMQLKDLIGVLPDPTVDQATYLLAQAAGADVYASIGGIPKVLTSGANKFFDQVYHRGWFEDALQVSLFNVLATVGTKIPQTEDGMDTFKKGISDVCSIAVRNGFVSPGEWSSPTTFGNQSDFLDNIRQVGYYIYSDPISEQLQVDREQRKAPLCQLAIKESGALHSGNLIVNINA